MASGARKITIEFLGKDTTAGKTANQVEGKYNKLGNRMNKVGAVAGKALAGGLLIAGAAAVKAGHAAAEDEAAQSKLANTLRNATGASKGQIAATESWITAQGKALGVADDELRPALGKLATATKDVGEAQKLASLAMDISAGSGKSLEQVTTALQKGVNGSVGGLSRLGVATKDASGKTKTMDQITKELAKTYNGAAAKAADTTAGKQRKLQVQFGELQEEIGAKLLPVMAKLAEWGLKTIAWMDKHQKLVGVLAGVLGGLTGTLYIVSKAMAAVNLVMSLNPIGAVIVALVALGVGLVMLYKKSETFRIIVKAAMEGVGAVFKWLWNSAFKPMLSFILLGLGNMMRMWGTMLRALGHVPGFGWAKTAGDKMYAAGSAALDLRDKINRVPEHHKTDFTADTKDARKEINSFVKFAKQQLSSLPKNVHSGVAPGTPGFARGTSSAPRGMAWVGERGPELVQFRGGERVIPNNKLGSAGGSATAYATINLNLDGKTVQQVLLKLKRTNGGLQLGLA